MSWAPPALPRWRMLLLAVILGIAGVIYLSRAFRPSYALRPLSNLRAIISNDFYPAPDLHRRLCDNSITASIDRKVLAQKLNARVKWAFGSEPLILMRVRTTTTTAHRKTDARAVTRSKTPTKRTTWSRGRASSRRTFGLLTFSPSRRRGALKNWTIHVRRHPRARGLTRSARRLPTDGPGGGALSHAHVRRGV